MWESQLENSSFDCVTALIMTVASMLHSGVKGCDDIAIIVASLCHSTCILLVQYEQLCVPTYLYKVSPFIPEL